jgi:EAL domain-containing protein (putative c-di-GMP-specific phosphodiesterase class I)
MEEADTALVRRILDQGAYRTVFQPIYSLATGRVVAVEALTRFTLGSLDSPAWWFSQAHAAELGVELELATLRCALETAGELPEGVSLSVNVSPAALLDGRTLITLTRRHARDLVVEITEQAPLHGHPQLLQQREKLRGMGIGVAIDDVVATRASVRHLFRLRPDEAKADLSLTAALDQDWRRRLLARNLVRIAHRKGAQVVAEGIETPAQLEAWRRLGADAVQGFLLATPSPLDQALQAEGISLA